MHDIYMCMACTGRLLIMLAGCKLYSMCWILQTEGSVLTVLAILASHLQLFTFLLCAMGGICNVLVHAYGDYQCYAGLYAAGF